MGGEEARRAIEEVWANNRGGGTADSTADVRAMRQADIETDEGSWAAMEVRDRIPDEEDEEAAYVRLITAIFGPR